MTKVIPPYDWTFSSSYEGSLQSEAVSLDDITAKDPRNIFDKRCLMKRDPILFSGLLDLFEDEMGDNGTSISHIRIVSL